MKISVNQNDLFELNGTQKKVICNDIHADEFEKDMKRRLEWVLTHKYERCFARLKAHWEPILATRVDAVPTDPEKFAELVFSQPDYKCRKTREEEGKAETRSRQAR